MYTWYVSLEVWPFSTGNGASADQQAVGCRRRTITVQADDIKGALVLAEHYVRGVRTGPMVWQVPIMGISRTLAGAEQPD